MPERMLFILTFDSACHIYIFCPIWVCEIIYVYLRIGKPGNNWYLFYRICFETFSKVDFDSKFHAVFVKRV